MIHRVFVDREGILWLGTEAGLVKMLSGFFAIYTTADGLPHHFVRAVTSDHRGRLWVGTRGGLAMKGKDKFFQPAAVLKDGYRVYDLLALPSGELWVATNKGVFQLRNDRLIKVWDEKDGLPNRFTFALAYDPQTRELFLGTWAGTACLKDHSLKDLPPRLRAARPLTLHVDRKGRLWVGLRDGGILLRRQDGSLQLLGSREGYTDQVVWSIASDEDGVWLGTNGDGALHVTESGIARWDSSRGLVDDFIWQVLPDRHKRVWLFTSQGLDRIDGDRVQHFGIFDGLPELEGSANACHEDPSGTLWFGTASGLARFLDPGKKDQEPPPVLLERATFGQGKDIQADSLIPSNPGSLTFSLVSLSFRHENAIRYSFRLLPVQPNWSPPQASGDVIFAGLGPGRYRFEAVAIDGEGRRSRKPASLSFVVATPWWQNPLLGIASVILVGAALALVARVRVVRLRRRAQELEQLVAQRTAELAEKAQELARLAETDELTGLANRRRFFTTLRAELQRLGRAPAETRLSLILMDLDGFKAINDSLGHNAGDALLREVAKAVRAAVRSTDLVARFGGDELAVILPMTDRAGALVAGQKILEAVKAVEIPFEGQQLRVTTSLGLAVVAPSAPFVEEKLTHLIQRADRALYAAKRRGGNFILDDQETWA